MNEKRRGKVVDFKEFSGFFVWIFSKFKINFWYLMVERPLVGYTLFSLYEQTVDKNIQTKISPEFKNKLRTTTRLKFWSDKFMKFIQ